MVARCLLEKLEERMVVHFLGVYILRGVVYYLNDAVLVDVAVEVMRPSLGGIDTRF